MNKQSEANPYTLPRVGYYSGLGLAGGITAGGVLELIRQIKAEREDSERMKRRQGTSGDTIVLTIPSKNREPIQKLAARLDMLIPDAEVKEAQTPSPQEFIDAAPDPVRPELSNTQEAKEWTPGQVAFSGLGLVGGAYGGLKLMETLGAKYREMMLKKRLVAAKRNHVNTLLGLREPDTGPRSKVAEAGAINDPGAEAFINGVFGEALIKEAQIQPDTGRYSAALQKTKDWINKNMTRGTDYKGEGGASFSDKAIGATMLLAMLGSAATAYGTKRTLDQRSKEQEDEEEELMARPSVSRVILKTASEDMYADPVDALTAIALSVLAYKRSAGYLKSASIVKEAAKHGLTPDDIINKLNHEDIVGTIHMLKKAEDLWVELRKPFEKCGAGMGAFLAGATGNEMTGLLDMDLSSKKSKGMDTEALAAELVTRIQAKKRKPTVVKEKVTVTAADPEAQGYIDSNKDRLKSVIQRLAADGSM